MELSISIFFLAGVNKEQNKTPHLFQNELF